MLFESSETKRSIMQIFEEVDEDELSEDDKRSFMNFSRGGSVFCRTNHFAKGPWRSSDTAKMMC